MGTEWSASSAEYLINLRLSRAGTKCVGHPLVVLDVVGSTNEWVKNAAERGAAEGLTVLALEQTAGKGRQGRCWSSPRACGVWMSVLLRPPLSNPESPILGVLGGLAALDAVRSLGLPHAVLKWPNDVLVGGRKIAGVLVESRLGRKKVQFAVMGIGLNLSQRQEDWSPELQQSATSFAMEGKQVEYSMAVVSVLTSLDRLYSLLLEGRNQELLDRWTEECGTDLLPTIER